MNHPKQQALCDLGTTGHCMPILLPTSFCMV